MRALISVTGRGLGGDAVIALNLIKALEECGVECEIALDESALGLLFKKNGYSWHKIKIPAAGGHAANKVSKVKAALNMSKATFKVRSIIKKIKPDFVVGVIGGGAVVGCFGAKLSGIPAVTLSSTPLDYKVCQKLNHVFIAPESPVYKNSTLPANVTRTFFPMAKGFTKGNKINALEHLKKENNFDENKKTILFSSGSSIFKGTIDALNKFVETNDDYNVILVGLPLKEDYLDTIDKNKVIYLGYVDYIRDLFDFVDLAVLTDDGIMLQEAIACEVPTVALTRVKWGRYHGLADVFKGAVVESEVDNINEKIKYAVDNLDSLKKATVEYSPKIIKSGQDLAKNILEQVKL